MSLAPVKNRVRTKDTTRARVVRRIRRTFLTVVLLALLIAIAALIYVWLFPPKPDPAMVPIPKGPQVPADFTPTKFGENVPIGSAIQSITTPVNPGDNASIILRTTERSICSIAVVHIDDYGKKRRQLEDSGLIDKKADEYGVVSWTWTMPADAALAEWRANIYCKRDNMSTESIGRIVVEPKKP